MEAPGRYGVAKLASPPTLEKAEMHSAAALVGDANGLSGRLCSKLYQAMTFIIFNMDYKTELHHIFKVSLFK